MSFLSFQASVGLCTLFLAGCAARPPLCVCPAEADLCTLNDAMYSGAVSDYLCPSNEQACDGQTIVTAPDGSWTLVYGSSGALVYAEGDITAETGDCGDLPSSYQVPACATPATPFPACGSNE